MLQGPLAAPIDGFKISILEAVRSGSVTPNHMGPCGRRPGQGNSHGAFRGGAREATGAASLAAGDYLQSKQLDNRLQRLGRPQQAQPHVKLNVARSADRKEGYQKFCPL